VVSAVAVVKAESPWAFLTLPGTDRVAPRWVFIDGSTDTVVTALDEIGALLRQRLNGVEDAELDERAIEVLRSLWTGLNPQPCRSFREGSNGRSSRCAACSRRTKRAV
jgi:hypothetical protein